MDKKHSITEAKAKADEAGVEFNLTRLNIAIRFTLDGVRERKAAKACGEQWPVGDVVDGFFKNDTQWDLTIASIGKAKDKLARVQWDIDHGTFDYATHFPNDKHTRAEQANAPDQVLLGTIFDAFEKECRAKYRKVNTLRKKIGYLNCWVRPFWAHRPAADLTVKAVKAWFAGIRDGEILPVANNLNARPAGLLIRKETAKLILIQLYGAIECNAGADVFEETNPLKGNISLDKIWGEANGNREEHKVLPFTQEDELKILRAATPRQQRLFKFWISTGLRIGELFALRWSDIDFTPGREVINVRFQYQNGVLTPELKNKQSERSVPLSAAALRVLQEQKAEVVQHLHQHVWPGVSGQPLTNPSNSFGQHEWARLLEAAGVTYREPEQCRHTCASRLCKVIPDTYKVSRLLGHKDVNTTNKFYRKWIEENEAINGHFRLPQDDGVLLQVRAEQAA